MQFTRSIRVALVVMVVLMVKTASAADVDASSSNSFWEKVRGLVQQCSVQTYTVEGGQKVYGPLRSNCVELQVGGSSARFELDGKWFEATIQDSPDSDGGDLNDVFVYLQGEEGGKAFAERHEIPAFGDILAGLAGAQLQLPELYVVADQLTAQSQN
jgi:hypothetical protein